MYQVHGTGNAQLARGVHDEPVLGGAEGPRRDVARAVQPMRAQLVWGLERWSTVPSKLLFIAVSASIRKQVINLWKKYR